MVVDKKKDEQKWICDECGKTVSSKGNLKRHIQIHLGIKRFECRHCPMKFTGKEGVLRHAYARSRQGHYHPYNSHGHRMTDDEASLHEISRQKEIDSIVNSFGELCAVLSDVLDTHFEQKQHQLAIEHAVADAKNNENI